MCIQAGESVTKPLTNGISGDAMVSQGASSTAWCDNVDCGSYGKWWCPFTGW